MSIKYDKKNTIQFNSFYFATLLKTKAKTKQQQQKQQQTNHDVAKQRRSISGGKDASTKP